MRKEFCPSGNAGNWKVSGWCFDARSNLGFTKRKDWFLRKEQEVGLSST